MDVAFHMLSLLHYNLLEVMVLRNKNPPVYAVTFIFILQGTFHYNFTVFFMKCNNIYIYVEFNPVAIFLQRQHSNGYCSEMDPGVIIY